MGRFNDSHGPLPITVDTDYCSGPVEQSIGCMCVCVCDYVFKVSNYK